MMIQGLYETHISVSDLERAIAFYKDIMELELASVDEDRRIAFFWVSKPKEYMLGLWEKPAGEVEKRHFAFRCSVDDVLNKSIAFLKARGLKPYNFLKDGNDKPMVFAWMPAVAIYFDDPDGNILEFIAVLDGPQNFDLGVLSYEDWLTAVGATKQI